MSSHREAPEISKDQVADNTDVYAFVSPANDKTVTLIANWIPLEEPAGGPNFYEFGNDVVYDISISNSGSGMEDITYRFRFNTVMTNPNTFLYNTGPIASLTDKNWNRRQYYSVSKILGPRNSGTETVLADNVPTPPCRIGPRSTPNYGALADATLFQLSGSGEIIWAGQRADPFYVDIGSIFDLGGLRPFNPAHLIPLPAAAGVNGLAGYNCHTIAMQIPMTVLTSDGSTPSDPMSPKSVIGVWASASRQQAMVRSDGQTPAHSAGPYQQVSRLANPLVNEVIIPMGMKDEWNASEPTSDANRVQFFQHPELATLIPILYPGAFPNLAKLNASMAPRADIAAIFLTGIPAGLIPGFQNNTGTTMAELMRLNMAIPPSANPSPLGLLGGDLAGFPNGRRVADNVVAIELRALAGVVYPLIDKTFTPDPVAAKLTDGTVPDQPYLSRFPYVGVPYEGYSSEHGKPGPSPS